MTDFIHAAWPVATALMAVFLIWGFWRTIIARSCWRCRTPLLDRRTGLKRLNPMTACGRCGAWRGSRFQ